MILSARTLPILVVTTLIGGGLPLAAQRPAFTHNVDPTRYGETVLAVVPMQGAGTATDPRRPLFAPNFNDPRQRPDPKSPNVIRSARFIPSDDGRFAIVEFVAKDRRGLQPILNHGRADVIVFEPRRNRAHDKAAVEPQIRRFKRDFDFDAFLRPPGAQSAAAPGQGAGR